MKQFSGAFFVFYFYAVVFCTKLAYIFLDRSNLNLNNVYSLEPVITLARLNFNVA